MQKRLPCCRGPRRLPVLTMGATGFQLDALDDVHHQPSDTCCPLGTDCRGRKSTQRALFRFDPFPIPVCIRIPLCPGGPLLSLHSGFLAPGIGLPPHSCTLLADLFAPPSHLRQASPLPPGPSSSSKDSRPSHGGSVPQLCRRQRPAPPSDALPRYAFSRFFFSVSM